MDMKPAMASGVIVPMMCGVEPEYEISAIDKLSAVPGFRAQIDVPHFTEQLARVGQPFYTTKARGLGVGLAMARRVVERAGGRLEIDSAPGRGTAVRLQGAEAV